MTPCRAAFLARGGIGSAVKVDDGFGGAQPPGVEGVSPALLPAAAAAAAAAALGFLWGGFPNRVTPAAVFYDTKRTKYV